MQRHQDSRKQQSSKGKAYPRIQIEKPEDLETLSRIGDSAVQLGAIVDVVAIEDTPLHARQLLQLTQRTGGTMICSSESRDQSMHAAPAVYTASVLLY